jgi:hypothetical protein
MVTDTFESVSTHRLTEVKVARIDVAGTYPPAEVSYSHFYLPPIGGGASPPTGMLAQGTIAATLTTALPLNVVPRDDRVLAELDPVAVADHRHVLMLLSSSSRTRVVADGQGGRLVADHFPTPAGGPTSSGIAGWNGHQLGRERWQVRRDCVDHCTPWVHWFDVLAQSPPAAAPSSPVPVSQTQRPDPPDDNDGNASDYSQVSLAVIPPLVLGALWMAHSCSTW